MKALTLTQPWATLVAIGAKRIETRSWKTPYRGFIAIHAAKAFPFDCQELTVKDPFRNVLAAVGIHGASQLPRGRILCLADLVNCIGTDDVPLDMLVGDEAEFGNFDSGRYAWIFSGIVPLKMPMPCRGALGLWETPFVTEDALRNFPEEVKR